MRQRYAIEDAEHPIYQRKPTMPAQPYTCETEGLESLREQVISLNRDRAELIEALRGMLETHSNITEGNLHSGAQERVAVKRDARALLSRLGGE